MEDFVTELTDDDRTSFSFAAGKSFTLGTWRKYGTKRGHGMSWLRAHHGQKDCTSPESGRDICAGEAWVRLAKGAYNETVSRDFHKERAA